MSASARGDHRLAYLSDAGCRVGVLNLPMSYPVEPVNGFMISGWMTPYAATDYTIPLNWRRTGTGDWPLSHLSHRDFSESRKDSFLKATYDLLDMRTRTALHLARTQPWDVFTTVFLTPIASCTNCGTIESDHPWRTMARTKSGSSATIFRGRRSIGRLLEYTDEIH